MKKTVIVQDFAGRPLMRALIQEAPGLVYVANPDLVEAVNNGESYPVGFPLEYAYVFDEKGFFTVLKEWEATGKVCNESWSMLTRFTGTNKMKEAAN